jgi:hypothetical protein
LVYHSFKLMKLPKNGSAVTFFALLLLLTFFGCSRHEPGTWKNNGIDAGIKEDFHQMNDLLFEAIKANKPIIVEKIMSKTMLNDPNNKRTIELSNIHLRKGKVTMLDEYYMVHDFNRENKIQAANYGNNSYALTYQPTTREMYMAFYIIKDGINQWLLSAVYNKLDYGWKLCELELNPYTISGKTAPELYDLAKKQYAKKYLIDAVNTMNLSRSCSLPNVMWSYAQQTEMNNFYTQVIDEAEKAYNFPVIIKDVSTQPKIFRVFNQSTAEGVFPEIYYLSRLNLKDTNAIKQEYNKVQKVIGKVLPGIDQDKKYLLYSVFSEKSGKKKMYEYHLQFTDILR